MSQFTMSKPFCNESLASNKYAFKKDGYCYQCPVCSSTYTIRIDSILYKAKKNLRQFLWIIFAFADDGSDRRKSIKFKVKSKNGFKWLNIIRKCVSLCMEERDARANHRLGQNRAIVEIDETSLKKKVLS